MLDLDYLEAKINSLSSDIAYYSDGTQDQQEYVKHAKRLKAYYEKEQEKALLRDSKKMEDVYSSVVKGPYYRKEFESLKPIGRRYY